MEHHRLGNPPIWNEYFYRVWSMSERIIIEKLVYVVAVKSS